MAHVLKTIDDRCVTCMYYTAWPHVWKTIDDRRLICFTRHDRTYVSLWGLFLPDSGISQYWGRRGGIRSVAWLSLPRHSRKLREVPADLEAEANLGTCISITSNIVKLAVGLPLNALG